MSKGGRGSRNRRNNRSIKGNFFPMLWNLYDSLAYQDLSSWAERLYLMYERKYTGKNNGDLNVSYKEAMEPKRFRSRKTLRAAHDELWSHGFLFLTRPGGFGTSRTCNLWALTTHPIDANPEKEILAGDGGDDWKKWSPGNPSPDFKKKFPAIQAQRQRSGKRAKK
jgi:hypothetical protein